MNSNSTLHKDSRELQDEPVKIMSFGSWNSNKKTIVIATGNLDDNLGKTKYLVIITLLLS